MGIYGCQFNTDEQHGVNISWQQNKYSELFKIGYNETDTLLKVFFIGGKELATYHMGKNPNQFPSTIKIKKNNRIAVSSSIFARFLTELNLGNSIVAIDNLNFVHSSLKSYLNNPTAIQPSGELQLEELIKSDPDIFFTYTLNAEGIPAFSRLSKRNIPVVYIQNHQEQHPLARSEWIKVFGLITDKLNTADEIFNQVDSVYLSLAQNKTPHKKTLMINAPYSGNWMVPNTNNYLSKLLLDASLNCIWQDKNLDEKQFTYTIPMESAMKHLLQADIWLNVGSYSDLDELLKNEPRIESVLNSNDKLQIFQNNKQQEESGANSYWDLGSIHPEILLNDLISIAKGKPNSLYFYQQFR